MDTIANYVSELLYRYECVIIPEFGAFLTRRQAASIHKPTSTFYPPKKSISFNSQLRNNDGLLANYIVSVENISYTDAVTKIQYYVLSINEKIVSGKRIELNNIGSFYTSIENTLQFEPSETNYLTEAFGLDSFTSPEIIREKYKKEIITLEEKTPITFTPESRNERPYLKYAAVAVITLGISGFFGIKKINNNTIGFNNIEEKQGQQMFLNQIQKATFDISDPLPVINLNTIKDTDNKIEFEKYHIVAGAFRIESNATKKMHQLRQDGYNARLIGVNDYGLHQVVYETYNNRAEATQALFEIKKEQDPKAWMLIKDF